jgi:hypothetical protein
MNRIARRFAEGLAVALAGTTLLPAAAVAEGAPVPRYTYLGAAYDWTDSKCAIEPNFVNSVNDTESESIDGFRVDGSLGILDFLHLTGAYFDGDSDSTDRDVTCYEVGAGLSYRFATSSDVVLRASWVNAELDDEDEDGFKPELMVRHMATDKVEINVGFAYYDVGDANNSEVRVGIVYNVLPWLAVQAGGSVFDDDSSFTAGVRAYFGGNLF